MSAEKTMANDTLEGSTDVSCVDSASVRKADLGTEGTRLSTPSDNNEVPIETSVEHTQSEKQHGVEEEAGEVAAAAAAEAAEEEDEEEYPAKWRLVLITLALCLSVFCMALDNTIIATAIPRITDQFHAVDDVGWYGAAYLLTTCSLQLVYGKLYTFYSIKWVYLAALFVFEVGSFVCGITPNSTGLILGRAVAGMGAAGVFSGALLIISRTVPLQQRPTFMGFLGGMYGIASVAGPLMGGAFTDNVSWRWCFYINLPFGAVTGIFIIFFFQLPNRKTLSSPLTFWEQLKMMDLEGTGLFIPGVICLLLALQWGGTTYAWSNGRIIALFILFGILITGFIAVQIWKQDRATVPPRIFKNRNVWGCAIFAAAVGAAFFAMVYYIPIWFQAIKGVSAVKSGIMNLPMLLGLVIVSMMSGGLITVLGYYTPFMFGSAVLSSIGAGLLTTFQVDTGHSKWIGYQFIFGAGIGLGMQQPMVAVQACLEGPDVAIGTAIIVFSQTLGGALFIAVAQNVFQNQLVSNIAAANIQGLSPAAVLATGATELRNVFPEKFLPVVLTAYNNALTQTFYVSTGTACITIIGALCIEWRSVKGKKIEMAPA